jgi:Lrp/AsnC family leucine-responsive transcriptional regulator
MDAMTRLAQMPDLDRTDRKILALLQEDGRMATVELAERIGLSPTATTERVKRLTRDGLITGYGARLDPALLGRSFLVFVEVLLDKTTPDVFDRFADQVRRTRDVVECHMVAGGFDYLLKVRVADMAAYRRFLGDSLWTIVGVRETRTYTVMEEVKADHGTPV